MISLSLSLILFDEKSMMILTSSPLGRRINRDFTQNRGTAIAGELLSPHLTSASESARAAAVVVTAVAADAATVTAVAIRKSSAAILP